MRQSVAAAPGVPVLQANNIAKHYGGLKAVKGVSIAVQAGQLRGLIGPNGAGKSTFFKMLAGEIEPTSGEVFLRGRNITGIGATPVCQMRMTKSYQANELFDALPVRHNLPMPAPRQNPAPFRLPPLPPPTT